ncbi:BZ3500_MvSof-1268-A1-R1_Chr12-2g03748 [Microbotryum saponariae]|uniref:BZ3500_MvSof-1268-A1-R1_Chr12-2g03748 protein n=1 Tax=Microbotryum saponariae TaxID=289078 RepID=A0A2X0KQ54_9BASI|nr:BZ3500_MvSof-1268-A1-R1_Chr12-2g03748 [Microbotryum saponariae]
MAVRAVRAHSRRRQSINTMSRKHWFVKSICTGSMQSQCRTASATGPQSFTSGLEIRSSTL